MLSYLYLLRVPLLTAVVLVALPWIGLTKASALLRGLFDVDGLGMFVVAIVTFLAAWTVMITCWLVLAYGRLRFNVAHTSLSWPPENFPPGKLAVAVFALLGLPPLIGVFIQSTTGRSTLVGAAAGGLAVALVMRWVVDKLADRLYRGAWQWVQGWVAKLGDGYEDPAHDRSPLLRGHEVALCLLVAVLALYVGIGVAKSLHVGSHPLTPTLAYVLLLIMLICWGIAGLAFFLDRYRIPVVLPLGLWFVFTSATPSDHYFRVMDRGADAAVSPAQALRAGKRSASVIAVAANGGGIQSAAWAAKVLTEVEIACRKRFPSDPTIFGESVRVISSVSGGSVGAAYFAEAYDPNGAGLPNSPEALCHIVDRAERSSLDEVAWGLVFPDLWRPIIPWFPWKYADRGQALEQALAYEGQGKVRPLLEGLSTWRKSVLDGRRPASIFNATIADTGERLLLTTTDMACVPEGRKTFAELGKNNTDYADKDIAVVTAARLSASFPYVSPAARSDRPGPQFHVVDGGYYDNYGISSLVEWLDEALRAPDNPIHRVLVLQIRGARSQQNVKLKNRRGWLYQSYAPIATMLHVRTAGQLSYNDTELDLFERAWLARGVDVESVMFEFQGDDPPLSWHLTPKDKCEIEKGWAKVLEGTAVTTVTDYLAADPSGNVALTGNHHH